MIRKSLLFAGLLSLASLAFVEHARAQPFYTRYVIYAHSTDYGLWTEIRSGLCPDPCWTEVQATNTDDQNFTNDIGSYGHDFFYSLHFVPKHPGRFINTAVLTWGCSPTKECYSSGVPKSEGNLTKTFYIEAIADSDFYFPSDFIDLTLKNDTSRRVVIDTFSLEYVNKSGTDVEVVGLTPLASDSANYHLSIVSTDGTGTQTIASTDSNGFVFGVFETVNGPDSNRRSCMVQVAYREWGVTRFDTIRIQYHTPTDPLRLAMQADTVRVVAQPGAIVDTTISMFASPSIDSIWIRTNASLPFRFVSTSMTDSVRTDVYEFKTVDARLSATSTPEYSFGHRLYNGEFVTAHLSGPVLVWSANLDSIRQSGALAAVYLPIHDTVATIPTGSIKVGTIRARSDCDLNPAFSILHYQPGLFYLQRASDTEWTVWLTRVSGDSGIARDSAHVYMTLSGVGCPTVDEATANFSVYRQPPASVRTNVDHSDDILVETFGDGRVVMHLGSEARVTLHSITGAVVVTADVPAGGTLRLSRTDVAEGFYYYTIRSARGVSSGKLVLP